MAKLIKVKFLESPTGRFKLGYFEGDVAEIPENLAVEMMKVGVVTDRLEENESNLPEDFPARAKFIALGMDDISELKKIDDLTQLDGIGPGISKQVKEYFEKQ